MPAKPSFFLCQRPGWSIFLLTFAVRLYGVSQLAASAYARPDYGDVKFYNLWAQRILQGRGTDGQAFYGLPGYAYLLAALFRWVGTNVAAVATLQALAEGVVAVLIYRIAEMIVFPADRRLAAATGCLAAAGYACYVPAQTFSIVLMPTTLLVCVFWLVVWWCLRMRGNSPSGWSIFGIGLLIGTTALMVATIFFVVPLVLAALGLGSLNRWGKKGALALLLCAGVVLGCSPAILYNRLVAHDSVLLSAHGGLNFFVGNNALSDGYLKIPAGLRASQSGMLADSISIAEKALGGDARHPIKRSAVSAYWSAQARAYIQHHPLAWLRLLGRKIAAFWDAYQYDDLSLIVAFREAWIVLPGLSFGVVSALGLSGMLIAVFRFPQSRWIAAAVLLHLGSLLTVFITERYRLAAVPGLLIFAAALLVLLWEALLQGKWKIAGSLAGLTALTTAWVAVPPSDQSVWALDAYNSGRQALEQGQLVPAERKLQTAWCWSPENAPINFALGNLYLARGDNQAAKHFYQQTIEINPREDGAWNNLGYLALQQKMPGTAIEFFLRSLAIEPSDGRTTYLLAQAFDENGQPAAALQTIEAAQKLLPDSDQVRQLQAKIIKSQP